MNRSVLIPAAATVVGLWVVVVAVVKIAGAFTVTPEKVVRSVTTDPLPPAEGLDLGEREREQRLERIDRVADQINRLNFEQRRLLREDHAGDMERFISAMSHQERLHYIERTVESHFRAVMHGFNQMESEDRRKLVDRIRRDMDQDDRQRGELGRIEERDREVFDRIVESGMQAYYRDANAETKLDLAPLLEEMQARMQMVR